MVIQLDVKLNSSSIADESVLEDTKVTVRVRSESSILRESLGPLYLLAKSF